jgi:cytochrome P450
MTVLPVGFSDVAIPIASTIFLYTLLTSYLRHRRLTKGTPLRGPPSHSFIFGSRLFAMSSPDPDRIFEQWAHDYGSVYRVADALGTTRVMIADPKALAHFYSKEGYGYVHTKSFKILLNHLVSQLGIQRKVLRSRGQVGRGLAWAEGDNHKRQRKALTPAFSNAAIRNVTHIFFDNAYKVVSSFLSGSFKSY